MTAPLLERYFDYLKGERDASPHTLRNYRRDISRFGGFLAARSGAAGDSMWGRADRSLIGIPRRAEPGLAPPRRASGGRSRAALLLPVLVREGALRANRSWGSQAPGRRRPSPRSSTWSRASAHEAASGPDLISLRDRAILGRSTARGCASRVVSLNRDAVDMIGEVVR
jgi:site-specific recombinase XerC